MAPIRSLWNNAYDRPASMGRRLPLRTLCLALVTLLLLGALVPTLALANDDGDDFEEGARTLEVEVEEEAGCRFLSC